MKTKIIVLFLVWHTTILYAQQRKEINLPNIPGYVTLKCDFHTHTVFSDGNVWPSIRVLEAWKDGLDVIAMTDHINYQGPFLTGYINNDDKNSSYNAAKLKAERLGITLIRGAEINRSFPPGHFNVLFTEDNNQLTDDDFFGALRLAKGQGAYIQWNHPNYGQKEPLQWVEMYDRLHNEGLINGVEVFNNNFFPEAVKWANDKKLTVTCTSDVHDLIDMVCAGHSHRPLTLVFAEENSVESIRKAMMAGQTAAYFDDILVGHSEHLRQLFYGSVEIINLPLIVENKKRFIQLINKSAINFELELVSKVETVVKMPQTIKLPSNTITLTSMNIADSTAVQSQLLNADYIVKNFKSITGEDVIVEFSFNKKEPVKFINYPKVSYPKVN